MSFFFYIFWRLVPYQQERILFCGDVKQNSIDLSSAAEWNKDLIVPGVPKKTLQRFNLHFLSYYLVNFHIQHHFLNPHDLSFSKHPQLLSLDQPKAEKIEENYRVVRNKTFWSDNCRFVNKPKILQKLSTLDQIWFEKDVYDGGYI